MYVKLLRELELARIKYMTELWKSSAQPTMVITLPDTEKHVRTPWWKRRK